MRERDARDRTIAGLNEAAAVFRDMAPFFEWAQSYLDSSKWAGRKLYDGIKAELLERDRTIAELRANAGCRKCSTCGRWMPADEAICWGCECDSRDQTVSKLRDELAEWRDSPPPNEQAKRDLALRVARDFADAYEIEGDSEEISSIMGPILGALDQHEANVTAELRAEVAELQKTVCRHCLGRAWYWERGGQRMSCSYCNGTGKVSTIAAARRQEADDAQ